MTSTEMLDFGGSNSVCHRFPAHSTRSGAVSPPLPPPPPLDQDELSQFGRIISCTGTIRPIVPEEEDLPGWVPKNYIEKGMKFLLCIISDSH